MEARLQLLSRWLFLGNDNLTADLIANAITELEQSLEWWKRVQIWLGYPIYSL